MDKRSELYFEGLSVFDENTVEREIVEFEKMGMEIIEISILKRRTMLRRWEPTTIESVIGHVVSSSRVAIVTTTVDGIPEKTADNPGGAGDFGHGLDRHKACRSYEYPYTGSGKACWMMWTPKFFPSIWDLPSTPEQLLLPKGKEPKPTAEKRFSNP